MRGPFTDPLIIAYSEETTPSKAFSDETQIGSITFECEAGQEYLLDTPPVLQADRYEDIVQVTLREDSAGGQECNALRLAAPVVRPQEIGVGSGWPFKATWYYRYEATENGPKTFVVTAHRVSGKGTLWRASSLSYGLTQRFTVRRMP